MSEPAAIDEADQPAGAAPWREWWERYQRETLVLLALLLVLAGPFLLAPETSSAPAEYDRRLVVITPHHGSIREEFGRAFARHWQTTRGERVFVDWRVPGGTSQIGRALRSEYSAAFQRHWEKELGRQWNDAVASGFLDRKAPLDAPGRQEFLRSEVGIGVDLFFGGGPYDFYQQAEMGTLVAKAGGKPAGVAAVKKKRPRWFSGQAIPLDLSGETFRDDQDRWCGTCLSSFGIVYNRDVLRRLGIEREPEQWMDLTDPRLFRNIALADPTKSGSVTKAFEMLIQQQMRLALEELQTDPGRLADATEDQLEQEAVRRGWRRGLKMIQAISANARYFTDASSKIPLEVAQGDAAAGMCIDFFGRSTVERIHQASGTQRIGFVAPRGGTSIAVDPIGLLRGAPDPELATGFIEFVLSKPGQALWGYRAGVPLGPVKTALRRLPVRRDLYTDEDRQWMSDGDEMPFEKARDFQYEVAWTGKAFSSIRFLIRVMCVDTHEELQQAWQEVHAAGAPPKALEALHDLELVRYDVATGSIADVLSSRDKIQETRLARKLGDLFRRQYHLATRMARRGH